MDRATSSPPGAADLVPSTAGARAAAWGVHALTASGVVFGLLSVRALEAGAWAAMMRWLWLCVIVDGIDGPLARRFRVKEVLPGFDGGTLDLVVDYFTYVLVPALVLAEGDFLPAGLRLTAAIAVSVSALYHYSNANLKTEDGYFEGFPAHWNVVIFYLYFFRPDPGWACAGVFLLCLLTLLPVKFIHPFRARRFQPLPMALALIWAVASGWVLLRAGPIGPALALGCLLPPAALAVLSLRRTFSGPDVSPGGGRG